MDSGTWPRRGSSGPGRPSSPGRGRPRRYRGGVPPTPRDAPPQSQTAILDTIRASRSISRVELAQATGLTPATVSIVVRRLLDSGLVVEAGHGQATGGKPRTLLQIQPTARYAVGVHLGEDSATYVLCDLGGAVVATWRRATPDTDPEAVVAQIAVEASAVVTRAGIDPDRLIGLGLVSPGPLKPGTGLVLAPDTMRQWIDFPLHERLARATGLPVLLDNDASASVVGSYWSDGIGPGTTMAALFMGKGIGAGLLSGGTVYRGARGNAGEVGHVTVQMDGPACWCGNRGCVEVLAGPRAVVDAARAAGLDLGPADRPVLTAFSALARRALAGERAALELVQTSARYVAVAAHTLCNILDLDLLVLTGPAFAVAGPLYLPVVTQHVHDAFFARGSGAVEVRLSTHGTVAAAIGAAALVLQSELAPRGGA